MEQFRHHYHLPSRHRWNGRSDRRPCHCAAIGEHEQRGGHEKVVSLLLDHGANPDQAEKNFGVTPLIAAAKNGHDKTVRVLVKHGCDFDRKDTQGWTAIMHASHESHTKVVAELARPGSPELVEHQQSMLNAAAAGGARKPGSSQPRSSAPSSAAA